MTTATAPLPAIIAVVIVGVASVALAGPASSFAREYVGRLEARERERELEGPSTPGPKGATPNANDENVPVTIRGRWLLGPTAQFLLAGLLCAVSAAWVLSRGAWPGALVGLPAVSLLAAASSVDAVCHRLPDRLLAGAASWIAATTTLRVLAEVVAGGEAASAVWPLGRAMACAAVALVVTYILALFKSGLGLGDVKLCALLGFWLGSAGAEYAFTGLIVGFFVAGIVAIVLMVARVVDPKQMIAMGPYIAIGGWLTWLLTLA